METLNLKINANVIKLKLNPIIYIDSKLNFKQIQIKQINLQIEIANVLEILKIVTFLFYF